MEASLAATSRAAQFGRGEAGPIAIVIGGINGIGIGIGIGIGVNPAKTATSAIAVAAAQRP